MVLQGCSTIGPAMGVIGALAPSGGISLDAQVGDKQNTLGDTTNTVIEDNEGVINQSNSKNQIKTADSVTIQEGMDMFTLIILILGWVMPSPSAIYTEFKRLLGVNRRKEC